MGVPGAHSRAELLPRGLRVGEGPPFDQQHGEVAHQFQTGHCGRAPRALHTGVAARSVEWIYAVSGAAQRCFLRHGLRRPLALFRRAHPRSAKRPQHHRRRVRACSCQRPARSLHPAVRSDVVVPDARRDVALHNRRLRANSKQLGLPRLAAHHEHQVVPRRRVEDELSAVANHNAQLLFQSTTQHQIFAGGFHRYRGEQSLRSDRHPRHQWRQLHQRSVAAKSGSDERLPQSVKARPRVGTGNFRRVDSPRGQLRFSGGVWHSRAGQRLSTPAPDDDEQVFLPALFPRRLRSGALGVSALSADLRATLRSTRPARGFQRTGQSLHPRRNSPPALARHGFNRFARQSRRGLRQRRLLFQFAMVQSV